MRAQALLPGPICGHKAAPIYFCAFSLFAFPRALILFLFLARRSRRVLFRRFAFWAPRRSLALAFQKPGHQNPGSAMRLVVGAQRQHLRAAIIDHVSLAVELLANAREHFLGAGVRGVHLGEHVRRDAF